MALTFSEAKRRYETRYAGKQLLTFDGATFPCKILCPKHGVQRASSYSNISRSSTGCPKCGRDETRKAQTARMTTRNVDNLDEVGRIRSALYRVDELEKLLEGDVRYQPLVYNLRTLLMADAGIEQRTEPPQPVEPPEGYVVIPGYGDQYYVNREGKVFSRKTGKIATGTLNKSANTLQTTLTYNGQRKTYGVHHLVLMTFAPEQYAKVTDEGCWVRRKDGDPYNNALDNLEVVQHGRVKDR